MKRDNDAELQFPDNIRRTKQREEVFRLLAAASGPMSAVDIYNQLLQSMTDGNFAMSTVYRVLAVFEEKGYVIKSAPSGSDMSYYEWCRGQHRHYAVCLKCHRMIPLKRCPFENAALDAAEDFTITGHKLELYGYCKGCSTKSNVYK